MIPPPSDLQTSMAAQELLNDPYWRKRNSRWKLWPWFSAFFFLGSLGWIGLLIAARRSGLHQLWRIFCGVLALNLSPFLIAGFFGGTRFDGDILNTWIFLAWLASTVGSIIAAYRAERIYLPWKAQQEAAGLPTQAQWWQNAALPPAELAGQAARTVIELDRVAIESDQKASFAFAADAPDAARLRLIADTQRQRANEALRLNDLAAGLPDGSPAQAEQYVRIIQIAQPQ